MPRQRREPPDLSTQAGRLVWARAAKGYPSARNAAQINRWNENTYKSRETAERRTSGIPPLELETYAKTFGVDLHWLAFGKGKPFPNAPEELPAYPMVTKRLAAAGSGAPRP